MAISEAHLCPPLLQPAPQKNAVSTPRLSLDATKQMVETAKATNEYTPLVRTVGSVFSTSDYLNMSFLKNEALAANEDDSGVDLDATAQFFEDIQHMPQNVVNALSNALERLVRDLRLEAPRLTDIQSLRQILIIFQTPLLFTPEFHKPILGPLLKALIALPPSSLRVLTKWWFRAGAGHFRRVVSIVQQYITIRLVSSFGGSLHNDDFITSAVRVLSSLHEVNEIHHLIPYFEFYNDLVNEQIDLTEDFTRWKQKSGFCFCDYAFVLDPATKSKILKLESRVQQHLQRQEALRRTLFMGTWEAPALVLRVRREHLIQDTLDQINQYEASELKKELRVQFVGEEAIDEGGVKKELFQLILRQIFDPQFGMFTYSTEMHSYWFNSNSTDFGEFKLIGILLGLAIYNSIILDLHFPFVVYKKLIGIKPNFTDLKDINPELAKGLQKLLDFEGNVEDTFVQTFQISYEVFGVRETHDLKEGGADIPVTNENRQEFVDLYTEYLLEKSIEKQFAAFLDGFQTVCMSPGFQLFRAEELELLICGNPVLDFEELEKVTVYDNGFHKDHRVIRYFWEIVHSLSFEEKKKLLFFSTGSDRAPIGGLGKLTFVISRHGSDDDRLPQAHTCFNHLLLPDYSSKEKLQECLMKAINNAEGFGMI
jgi:hypothetical protein